MNQIIQNPDGSFSSVPATSYDPVAASTAYLQAVAALNLAKANATTTITTQVNQQIAEQQAEVAQMLADLTAALSLDSSIAASVQPNLDSAQSQFPDIVTAITPVVKNSVKTETPAV